MKHFFKKSKSKCFNGVRQQTVCLSTAFTSIVIERVNLPVNGKKRSHPCQKGQDLGLSSQPFTIDIQLLVKALLSCFVTETTFFLQVRVLLWTLIILIFEKSYFSHNFLIETIKLTSVKVS